MSIAPDPFHCAPEEISEVVLRDFVVGSMAARVQAESLVLEFKSQPSKKNVAEAVAAMANTDGGLVIVGVDERRTEDPLVGITREQTDGVSSQLRALLPEVRPDVIPVALSGTDRAVVVLRVHADRVERPVVLSGRVLVRSPGHTTGARRDEIVTMVETKDSPPHLAGVHGPAIDVSTTDLWGDDVEGLEARVHAHVLLPPSASSWAWLPSATREAVQSVLFASPIPSRVWSHFALPRERFDAGWDLVESHATRFVMRSERTPTIAKYRPPLEGLVLAQLSGRHLDIVGHVRAITDGGHHTELQVLHELLLGTAVTAENVRTTLFAELQIAGTATPPRWSGRVFSPSTAGLTAIVDRWIPPSVEPRLSDNWRFGDDRTGEPGVAGLDRLIRGWLTRMALDLSAVGLDEDIERLPLPRWCDS